jgi:hypothetical protein
MPDTPNKKLFSLRAIGLSAFLGGPLSAGYLIAHNFKVIGDRKAYKITLFLSLFILVTLIVFLLVIPESLAKFFPSGFVSIITIYAAFTLAKTFQKKQLDESKKNNLKESGWKAVLISIICLLITLVVGFAITYVIPENHDQCTVNEKNRNKKVFDQNEATCFIYKHSQNNNLKWNEISDTLTEEYNYQQSKDMLNTHQNKIIRDYDPVPFIQSKKKTLSEDKIKKILLLEDGYLKFIGAIQD